jgi:hypothetical protein
VAQNLAQPIPSVSDWIEMSQLMTQALNFGWRNTATFDPVANEGMMLSRLGLTLPGTVGEAGTVQLVLTANGFVGDTIALVADCYTPEQKAIQIMPTKITQDGGSLGVQVTLDPGFCTLLTIQYWNTSGKVPSAGSTLTLTAGYLVPNQRVERALTAGVIDSRQSLQVARQVGIGPQAIAPLGAATFVASPAGP